MRARSTILRTFVAALTIGALAACGGDDDDVASDTTEAEASDTTEAEAPDTTEAEESDTTEADETDTSTADTSDATTAADGGEFCTLVDPALLDEVTGLEWADGESAEDACTWATVDGSSAFNITGVEIPDAATAEAAAGVTCDDGTIADPGFVDAGLAEFGISCLVSEVATVQVYGEGVLLTFVAYTTVPDVPVEQVQSDLNTIVEQVLSS